MWVCPGLEVDVSDYHDIDLPRNPEVERLLLSALILLPVQERDAAADTIRAAWFSDLWNRRVINALLRNRGREFGRAMLDTLKSHDAPGEHSAWYLALLFADRDGESTSGRPLLWREHAYTVERLYDARCKILIHLEKAKEAYHAVRIQTMPLCEPARKNARTNDANSRDRSGALCQRSTHA
jgi:hypothetical protein